MKHKSLLVYVPCLDGGCEDVGRIELDGHTLVSDERLWDLEAAEKHAAELEERCAALTDALRSTAQTLAWIEHGKCRGFSDDLLTTNEALKKARAALEKLK